MNKNQGNIPVKFVEGNTIVEAFEEAMRVVWTEGVDIPTEYDIVENKSGGRQDPPSKDATVSIVVHNPFTEPRIPKAFYDSLENLGKYIHEVVNGVRDYRIKPKEEILKAEDAGDTRWTYTYHQRLFDYEIDNQTINQIACIIDRLSKREYSRRAQAITWNVRLDAPTNDPPCLQRVWCRILRNEQNHPVLNLNTHWRSHDLFKAWVENAIALTELQKRIADQISQQIGEPVLIGRYAEMNDSLHIYGSYFKDVEGFFANLEQRKTLDQRAWTTEFATPFFKDGLEQLLRDESQYMSAEKIELIKQEIKKYEG